MTTGFFLFPDQNRIFSGRKRTSLNQEEALSNQGGSLSNQRKNFSYRIFLWKNTKLYVFAILLYLPLSIYAGYFNQAPFFSELLKDIIFNGTFYHLWYFPAVILGVSAIVLMLRLFRFKTAFFITFLLYLIGLFGDSYYEFSMQIPLLSEVYHILFQCFDYTRNGLFFTPFYLMLGIRLSKKVLLDKNKPLSRKRCISGLFLSLALMVAEGLFLHLYSQPRHDSMYLTLPLCMYFLFQLLILKRGTAVKGLRLISLMIYLIHPWCIVLIRGLAKAVRMQDVIIQNSIIFFLMVTALTSCLSVISYILWLKQKDRWVNRISKISISRISVFKIKENHALKKCRTWAEINLSNLRYNLILLEQTLPEDCQVMAVVKANAYGHGAVPIAAELQASGVSAFAVACMAEGILLRKKGIKGTILILGYTHPNHTIYLLKYHLTQTVVDYSHAVDLNRMAADAGKKLQVHLKIDTGMHRLGEDYTHFSKIADIFQLPYLKTEGVFTHLCVADSTLAEDVHFTREQLERFYQIVDSISRQEYPLPALHVQSSYGILNYPELNCSYARIGIALYGALSQEQDKTKISVHLKPVLSIRSRISIIKELAENQTVGYGRQFKTNTPIRIATVSIGYADGIPRNLTDAHVLINGKSAPIIGRICMDQLTVDITRIPEAKQGGIVTILGQDGDETILPEQLAQQAGTITNELYSRLGDRLERIYISS